eukprot:g5793.t1
MSTITSKTLLAMAKRQQQPTQNNSQVVLGNEILGLQTRLSRLDAFTHRIDENVEGRFLSLEKMMKKMKKAFDALSDTVLEEVDSLRDEQDSRWNDVDLRINHIDVKLKNINRELNEKNNIATQEELEHNVIDTLAQELETIRKDANKVHQANTKIDLLEQKYLTLNGKMESVSSLSTNADRWVREIKDDCLHIREEIDKTRNGITTAAGALAQDIAALADDAHTLRESHMKFKDDTQKRLVSLAEIIEEQHHVDITTHTNQMEELVKEIQANDASLRDALRVSLKQQIRLRKTLTDGLTNVGKELGATAKHSKLLEDLIRREVQRLEDLSVNHTNDVQNQFQAMSTAMNAFADVLQMNVKSKGVEVVFNRGVDISN